MEKHITLKVVQVDKIYTVNNGLGGQKIVENISCINIYYKQWLPMPIFYVWT